MSYFGRRRRLGWTILAITGALTWAVLELLDASLRSSQFYSGWLLLVIVIALALFNVRKKLPFLPLGNATAWMEFHTYAGLFAIGLFAAHAGLDPLHGALEWALALLFAAVAGSGLLGLLITRALPHRLDARGEAILFERIPAIRRRLHEEVEDLVVQAAREVPTTTISEFYTRRLASFFARPRNLVRHWLDSAGHFRELEQELFALDRYTNDQERSYLERIHAIMVEKEALDYRWAQGVALKGWLYVHVPLTYAFGVVIAAHVLLALGFQGRMG